MEKKKKKVIEYLKKRKQYSTHFNPIAVRFWSQIRFMTLNKTEGSHLPCRTCGHYNGTPEGYEFHNHTMTKIVCTKCGKTTNTSTGRLRGETAGISFDLLTAELLKADNSCKICGMSLAEMNSMTRKSHKYRTYRRINRKGLVHIFDWKPTSFNRYPDRGVMAHFRFDHRIRYPGMPNYEKRGPWEEIVIEKRLVEPLGPKCMKTDYPFFEVGDEEDLI